MLQTNSPAFDLRYRIRINAVTLFLLLLVGSQKLVCGEVIHVYGIGNSLTVDMYSVLDELTASQPNPLSVGWHAKCGDNLTNILAEPNNSCSFIDPYTKDFGANAKFTGALQNYQLDGLSLQPFAGVNPTPGGGPSSIRDELTAASTLINLYQSNSANANSRIFVYATTSLNFDVPGARFQDNWNAINNVTLDSPFLANKEVYDLFTSELSSIYSNVELLPIGQVFDAVANQINANAFEELDSVDKLFRDSIHASYAGRYIEALTAYAVIYGQSPEGLQMPGIVTPNNPDPAFGFVLRNQNDSLLLQRIVAETVFGPSPVPEPSQIALLSITCLLGFYFIRRRQLAKVTLSQSTS